MYLQVYPARYHLKHTRINLLLSCEISYSCERITVNILRVKIE